MDKIELERRLTHRYNAGWAHLDEHEFVGRARIVMRKPHGRPNDESRRTFSVLLVSSPESPETIAEAISDTMRHSCRCEHDCCGHWQSSVIAVRPLRGKLFAVIESAYPNT